MFKVRVRNFQSIKDATLTIDGLTVVTGANNSGKTALMRAIRGVFENSPHGSLLRKGEDKISVDLEFEDGKSVLWEKGPKDNSYTINGYKLTGVGRGAPEELKELGIYPLTAANNVIWPQVANQFDGTIFLLNRSGAVLAEALSDAEKVGRLTSALRLSESDRRSVNSELKVRRKDLKAQNEKVELYDGFEVVEEDYDILCKDREALQESFEEYTRIKTLFERYKSCKDALQAFDGFDPDILPEKGKLERLNKATNLVQSFNEKKSKAESTLSHYAGFQETELPKEDSILEQISQVSSVRRYLETYRQRQSKLVRYTNLTLPELPEETELLSMKTRVSKLRGFLRSERKGKENLREFQTQEENLRITQEKVLQKLSELLGDLGECPVCKTPHNGDC